MEIKGMKEEFFDWLSECPVQWTLQTDDEDSISYEFYKEDDKTDDNEEEED